MVDFSPVLVPEAGTESEAGTASGLRPLARPRLYEQLVEALLAYVARSGLGPGQRLPTERDLAQRLGVSRASVRQAIVALEVQGVVDVRHGDGIYLLRQPAPAELLAELAERRRRLPDVLEARATLELKIVELAALRRTDDDLARIDAALESMAAEILAGGHGLRGDEAFHGAVTTAAHNPVLADLMRVLAHSIEETRRESLNQPNRPPRSLAGHRQIAEAIRGRDCAGAGAAMRAHLDLVSDVALLRWNGTEEQEGMADGAVPDAPEPAPATDR